MYKQARFANGLTITEATYTNFTGTQLPFLLEYKYLQIYRNGMFLTEEVDYHTEPEKITFMGTIVIELTDLIKVVAYS